MTDNLFRYNWTQKRSASVSVILEELLVAQGAKRIMNMNSNVNTVVNSYFFRCEILPSFLSVASERSFSRFSLL